MAELLLAASLTRDPLLVATLVFATSGGADPLAGLDATGTGGRMDRA